MSRSFARRAITLMNVSEDALDFCDEDKQLLSEKTNDKDESVKRGLDIVAERIP